MTQALFEARDESEQVEHRLSKEVAMLKDNLKDDTIKVEEAAKQLAEVTKKKQDVEATLASLVQDVERLRGSNEQLKPSLKYFQINHLLVGDEASERAKAQALFLQWDLNVTHMDFIKVILDGWLLDIDVETSEAEAEGGVDKEPSETASEKIQTLDDQLGA